MLALILAIGGAGYYYLTMPRFIDVDAMALRMKANQDLYQRIRDEALSDYSMRNANHAPCDAEVKTVIRILAYLTVWDDFYGEGLWQHGAGYARDALDHGASDPLLLSFIDLQASVNAHSNAEDDVERMDQNADRFLTVAYPSAFKMKVCETMTTNLTGFLEKNSHPPGPQAPSMAARYHFIEKWGENYRELIRQKLPHTFLYFEAEYLQYGVEYNQDLLDLVIAEQDRDFNEVDPANPVKLELDGNYFVAAAWTVRGGDYSSTVSGAGWNVFGERLAQADKILEPIYDQYPAEVGTCHVMLRVELGQGQGRNRMELWFQRGIKADPDCYKLYECKQWYLQPRWFGSEADILNYGRECVATGNWSAKVPMIFTKGIHDIADNNPGIYNREDIGPEVEKIYRDYLRRYPNSIDYRTSFAKHACEGGYLDVAREQFKILGDDWDRGVLSEGEYATIIAGLKEHQ